MTALRLAADDLTGALDAGAAFTGALGPLAVALGPREAPVVDLGVREAAPDAAAAAGRRAGPGLAAAATAFLKIDSVLRGPWAALLAGALAGGGFDRALLAPAFPAQGRVTLEGRQWLLGPDGGRAPAAVEPLAAAAQAGLSAALWSPGAPPPAAAVLLCDAECDADLARIVARGRALPGRTLWVGSAGLAAALAGAPAAAASPPRAARLAVIGAQAPATAAQVERLLAAFPHADTPVGERGAPSPAEPMLLRFPMGDGVGPRDAAARIAARLRRIGPALPRPGWVMVSGGETFASLCAALGATGLTLLGQHAPGLPLSRIDGGAWDGVVALSKSGGFGGPSLLTDLWRVFRPVDENF